MWDSDGVKDPPFERIICAGAAALPFALGFLYQTMSGFAVIVAAFLLFPHQCCLLVLFFSPSLRNRNLNYFVQKKTNY